MRPPSTPTTPTLPRQPHLRSLSALLGCGDVGDGRAETTGVAGPDATPRDGKFVLGADSDGPSISLLPRLLPALTLVWTSSRLLLALDSLLVSSVKLDILALEPEWRFSPRRLSPPDAVCLALELGFTGRLPLPLMVPRAADPGRSRLVLAAEAKRGALCVRLAPGRVFA